MFLRSGAHLAGGQTTLSGIRQIPAVVVPWFPNNVARNSLAIISNIEIKYFLSLFVIWEVTVSRILFRNRFVVYSMDVSCFLRESDFLFFCCVSFATLFLPLSKSI